MYPLQSSEITYLYLFPIYYIVACSVTLKVCAVFIDILKLRYSLRVKTHSKITDLDQP